MYAKMSIESFINDYKFIWRLKLSIKFDNNLPIYIQIMDWIKHQIVSAKILPGEKLLSVRDMSAYLNVNPNTIQRVYRELEREEIVFSKRGMGMYVNVKEEIIKILKKDMGNKAVKNFMETMKLMGYDKDEILGLIEEFLSVEKYT